MRTTFLVALASFLAGVCVAITISPKAEGLKLPKEDEIKFSVAFGQCRYQKAPDGLYEWRSDQFHASIFKDNGCGELGISGKLNPSYGWSMRYVNLGRAHTRGLTATCPGDDCGRRDPAQDPHRPECGAGFNEQNCEYQWNGDGGLKGLNFSVNRELWKVGPVHIEGELGVLLYQMKWNIQVFPMGCSDGDCPWRVTVDQKTGYFLSPMGGLTARLPLTKSSSVFVGSRLYLRTSQHVPISAGIARYVQCWIAGIQTTF